MIARFSLTLVWMGWLVPSLFGRTTNLPPVDDIIAKTIARASQVAEEGKRKQYIYTKTSITEHLDAKGQVTEKEERVYDVILIGSMPYPRLVRINGRELTAKELKAEAEREEKARERIFKGQKPARSRRDDIMVTEELTSRFQFEVLKEETVNLRPAWVVRFRPKSADLPVNRMVDKLLNKVEGTVWIDREDYEIAKVNFHLADRATLWGGLLGALEQFRFSLERQRIPEGVWFNKQALVMFEGRRLFETLRVRTREAAKDIRKAETDLRSQGE